MGFTYSWPYTRAWCLKHRTIHDTGDESLARRIESIASDLCRLRKEPDAQRNVARMSALRSDLFLRCYEYFYVVGKDLNGHTHDSLFNDALIEAIDTFDNEKGKFIPHMRNRFKFVRLRAYTSEYQKEAQEEEVLDQSPVGELTHADDPSNELELAEDNALYARLLVLVCQFLDHTEDGWHKSETKAQRRMVFAEMITRLVKMQTRQEHLAQFGRHESDTVRATEIGFLDSYMTKRYGEGTRFFLHVWSIELRDFVEGPEGELLEVAPIRRLDEVTNESPMWRLPNGAFLRYYQDAYGKMVTSGSVSRWRDAFYKLISDVGERKTT